MNNFSIVTHHVSTFLLKITPVSKYRHEGEPIGLVLITVFRDATKDLCFR